jgi:hypothetical protein
VLVIVAAATASTTVPTTASALRPIHCCHCEMGGARDFRRDNGLISLDLVGIDLSIIIDVEKRIETVRVCLHLIKRKLAVMVAVGLLEPVGDAVGAAIGSKGLAHGTDEQSPAVARGRAGGRCGRHGRRRRRLGGAGRGEDQQGKQRHNRTEALNRLAGK